MNQTLDAPCLKHKTADAEIMTKEDKKLEYIGDAVITLAIRLYFTTNYPQYRLKAYGEVASQLCSNSWLTKIAFEQGMNGLGGYRKGLANRFEAHVAELFHNYGFDSAKSYIWGILEQYYKPVYHDGVKKFIWKG